MRPLRNSVAARAFPLYAMRLTRWGRFGRLFRESRGILAASIVLSAVQSLALLPVALVVSRVFDTYVPRQDTAAIAGSGALVLALYLVSATIGVGTAYLVLKASRSAVQMLRGELLARVLAFPRAWFDRTSIGRLHATIIHDAERVDTMANALVGLIMPAVIVTLGLSAILVVLDATLFALVLAVVPPMLLVGRLLGRRVRRRSRRLQRIFDAVSSGTHLTLRAATLVKVQGAEEAELRARGVEHERLGEAELSLAWLRGAYQVVQGAVAACAGAVVLVFGGIAAAHGQMSMGDLIAFYAVLALLLRQVTLILSGIPNVLVGYESLSRLDDLLTAEEREPYSGSRRVERIEALDVARVSFGYGGEPLLQEVDLSLERGERAALFGPNGAGKSTLVRLLLALYRPDAGRILADGVPYDELEVASLRRCFGVVLQDPIVFPGSVAENIAYGHSHAAPEAIRRAAALATADEFINELPDGYETVVGDDGALLSGGQRQRLAIARALVGDPSVLVLDEPTTHLDDQSIQRLMRSLAYFPGAPALLVISHDPQVLAHVDTVHHMRDGRMVHSERRRPRRRRLAAV